MNRPFEFLGIVASGYAVKDDLMNGHSTEAKSEMI